MIVVLGFYDGYRDIGLEVENEICALALPAAGFLAFYEDAAVGKKDFLADLAFIIPTGFDYGR